jgi:hypothetical protein
VSQRRRAIATAVLLAGFAVGLSPAGVARASEGNDIQELRREVSRMRAEVEAIQVAITQANDLERQRTEKLRRALDAQPDPSTPAPAAAPAETTEPPSGEPAPRAAPASDSEDKSRGSTKHKRHKRSGRARAKAGRAHAADGDR